MGLFGDFKKKFSTDGTLGMVGKFIGIDDQVEDMLGGISSLMGVPEMLITGLKWTAIGVGGLLAVGSVIFLTRYAFGKGPSVNVKDVADLSKNVLLMTPAGQKMAMM